MADPPKLRVLHGEQSAKPAPQVNADLVEYLAEKLEEAKRGELQNIVGITGNADGSHAHLWIFSPGTDTGKFCGELHILLLRLSFAEIGRRKDD